MSILIGKIYTAAACWIVLTSVESGCCALRVPAVQRHGCHMHHITLTTAHATDLTTAAFACARQLIAIITNCLYTVRGGTKHRHPTHSGSVEATLVVRRN